jgi:hypothetical protein
MTITCIAPTNQDDVAEIFKEQHIYDVLNVGTEIDSGVEQMGALACASQCRRIDIVAYLAQEGATSFQHHPPPQAPWTSRNVAIAHLIAMIPGTDYQ